MLGKASRPHAIIDASEAGDDRALRCALQAQPNANLDALGGAGGVTALMAAVSGDHRACAGLLLAAAADPDATRSIGLTALHIASIRGHDECVALLSVSAAVTRLWNHAGAANSRPAPTRLCPQPVVPLLACAQSASARRRGRPSPGYPPGGKPRVESKSKPTDN